MFYEEDVARRYYRIFRDVVNSPNAQSSLPVPWFACTVWRDLQWAAYIGPCQDYRKCLGFGLNLEKSSTWNVVRRRVHDPGFRELLTSLENIEWRWHGRPRQKMPNPPYDGGGPYSVVSVSDVDVEDWLLHLDEILDGKRRWDGGKLHGDLIRPQLQLVRCVGQATEDEDSLAVADNMRAVMADLQPLVAYLSGGRY